MPVSLSVGRVPNGSLPAHAATHAPIRDRWVYSNDVWAFMRIARMTVKHGRAARKPSSAIVRRTARGFESFALIRLAGYHHTMSGAPHERSSQVAERLQRAMNAHDIDAFID